MESIGSCAINAPRRNRETGQVTHRVSQLHKDLVGLNETAKDFTRERANTILCLSQSKTFLEANADRLIYDSEELDAEPKLASLFNVAKDRMPEVTYDDIAQRLAKKFKFGITSFENALDDITNFNMNDEGCGSFIATMMPTEDGNYQTMVVLNTEGNQNLLISNIQNQLFAREIQEKLHKYGVTAVATTEGSRYDTTNPQLDVDGYYGLIKLNGGLSNLKSLYKETGHFLIEALGRAHPLNVRMRAYLRSTPEIVKELLGEQEYIEIIRGENWEDEAIGHIVGKFLEYQLKKNDNPFLSFWKLIKRAVSWIGTKLPLKDRQYRKDLYNALAKARKIAKAFLKDRYKGDVKYAIHSDHILYDNEEIPSNKFISNLKTVILGLIKLQRNISELNMSTKLARDTIRSVLTDYKEALRKLKETVGSIGGTEWQTTAAQALNTILDTYIKEIDTYTSRMQTVLGNYNNNVDMPLNKVANIVRSSLLLLEEVLEVMSSFKSKFKENIYADQYDAIDEYRKDLEEVVSKFEALYNEVERKLSLQLLSLIHGSHFIIIELHLRNKSREGKSRYKLVRNATQYRDLRDELQKSSTIRSWTWYSRWIAAMADSPDLINQLVAQCVEERNYVANNRTLELKDEMFDLYNRMRKEGIKNTRVLFEKNKDGSYSGNLISERHWGEWEKAYDEWKKETEKRWVEAHPEKHYKSRELYIYDPEYRNYWRKEYTKWHYLNSSLITITDPNGENGDEPLLDDSGKERKAWAPKLEDDGNTYELPDNIFTADEINDIESQEKVYYEGLLGKLTDEQFELYDEYMQKKRQLDSLIGLGKTNVFGVRAPQFLGSNMQEWSGYWQRRLTSIKNQFVVNSEDTEWGTIFDAVEDDELATALGGDIYDAKFKEDLNTLNKLPVYGIRKINPKLLSTDLVQSTIAYGHMAYKYQCLSEVVGAVEVMANDIKRNRKLNDANQSYDKILSSEGKDTHMAGDFTRLTSYMEMNVYNNYALKSSNIGSMQWRKFLKVLGRSVSLFRLGFNSNSALVNAMTALHEIFKESGNEEYSLSDTFRAMGIYIFYNMWDIGSKWVHRVLRGKALEPNNKLALIGRKFDFEAEIDGDMRNYFALTFGKQTGFNYSKVALWLFKVTSKWAANIPIIASMLHTKMRNKHTGERRSLWSIYEEKDNKLQIINGGQESDWEIHSYQLELIVNLLGKESDLDREKKDAMYVKNDKYNSDLLRNVTTYTVDGISGVNVSRDELLYYKLYSDTNAEERKIYTSYELINNENEMITLLWVEDPNTDSLIPISFDDDGNAIVEFLDETMLLNDYFNLILEESLNKNASGDDDLFYDFNYTDDNIWDSIQPDKVSGRDVYYKKSSYATWNTSEQTKYRMRVRAINNRLHGVYNKYDLGMYAGTLVGMSMAVLKKYMLGYVSRKMSGSRVDLRTGKHREGTWRSFGKFVKEQYVKYDPGEDTSKWIRNIEKGSGAGYATARILWGSVKLAGLLVMFAPFVNSFINLCGCTQADGKRLGWHRKYLYNRGYSENQISNVHRFLGDLMKWLEILLTMSWLKSYGLHDTPENDNIFQSFMRWIANTLLKAYIGSMKLFMKIPILGPKHMTIDDERLLTEEHLIEAVKKATGDYPFDPVGITEQILDRSRIEQEGYLLGPTMLNGAMRKELWSMINGEVPGLSLLLDLVFWAESKISGGKTTEELKEMQALNKSTKGYRLYDPENNSDWYELINQKGLYEGFFKHSKAGALLWPFIQRMTFSWLSPTYTMNSNNYYMQDDRQKSKWGDLIY